jgi:hypothetical protein
MFYLLLIVPHVLALGGLFAIAFRTSAGGSGDDEKGGPGGPPTDPPPPRAPQPVPSGGGLPLEHADHPRHRLPPGERLAEQYPRPVRREHEPPEPRRAPTRDS